MAATTVEAPRAATRARPRDLRRFWRLLLAVVLPIGPLGVTVSRAVMPYWTSDDAPTIVAKVLANPGAMDTLSWIGLVIMPSLLLSTLALGYLARRGAPVLASLGSGISFLAYANWGAAGNNDYLVPILGRLGIDHATIVEIVEAASSTGIAVVSAFGWVVGHIVGMILLGVALYRAGVIPRWAGLALALSQPIHFVSAVVLPSRALDVIAGWGLTTVGFVMVSLALLRMTDDEFDLR